MSDDWASQQFQSLVDSVRVIFEELAPEIADDAKLLISVPVEYAGGRIIRSAPGEPPRTETGALIEDTQNEVEVDGAIISLSVFWMIDYSLFLEGRTSRMAARPFAGPTFDKWKPVILERLAFSDPITI